MIDEDKDKLSYNELLQINKVLLKQLSAIGRASDKDDETIVDLIEEIGKAKADVYHLKTDNTILQGQKERLEEEIDRLRKMNASQFEQIKKLKEVSDGIVGYKIPEGKVKDVLLNNIIGGEENND